MFTSQPEQCPCQSGKTLDTCCGPLLSGERQATTAEALMRSRYSAFALGNALYLLHTHHPSSRSDNELSELTSSIEKTHWTNLKIIQCEKGKEEDTEGRVTFEASFIQDAQPGQLKERSRFVRKQEKWYYVDGEAQFCTSTSVPPTQLPGRNAPCWCGSGKKFKKCHGA